MLPGKEFHGPHQAPLHCDRHRHWRTQRTHRSERRNGGALDFVAKRQKRDATRAKVTCAVSIGPRDAGGFGLAVKLRVEDKSLPQADLAALAKEAHEQICPYSHATRGNVDVAVEVVGG